MDSCFTASILASTQLEGSHSILKGGFHCRGSAVKQEQACSNSSKDGESSFHHCGGPVKLVQACLWYDTAVLSTVKVLWSSCNPVYVREWPDTVSTAEEVLWNKCRLVLSAHKDRESSLHHCGSSLKIEHACLSAWKHLESNFHHCGCSVIL